MRTVVSLRQRLHNVIGRRFSSGADIGQGSNHIGAIAADEIVAGTFGRAATSTTPNSFPVAAEWASRKRLSAPR